MRPTSRAAERACKYATRGAHGRGPIRDGCRLERVGHTTRSASSTLHGVSGDGPGRRELTAPLGPALRARSDNAIGGAERSKKTRDEGFAIGTRGRRTAPARASLIPHKDWEPALAAGYRGSVRLRRAGDDGTAAGAGGPAAEVLVGVLRAFKTARSCRVLSFLFPERPPVIPDRMKRLDLRAMPGACASAHRFARSNPRSESAETDALRKSTLLAKTAGAVLLGGVICGANHWGARRPLETE